jgi:hypothetical protein
VGWDFWYCGHYWPIVPAPDDRWWWSWRNWWNEDWQWKPKHSENTCLSATLSTTNPTLLDPGLNPGRRGEKPAWANEKITVSIRCYQSDGYEDPYFLWAVTARNPLKANRRFEGTCCRHLQHELWLLPASCWFVSWLILLPKMWERHVPPKRLLTFNALHGLIFQKRGLFQITVDYSTQHKSNSVHIQWILDGETCS